MQPPEDKILLFRITHIDNLELILTLGVLPPPSRPLKGYTFIGDQDLTSRRRARRIEVAPHGDFADYVGFYLGPCSPMLYKITHPDNGTYTRNEVVWEEPLVQVEG